MEEGKLEADPSLKRPRKDGWGYVQTFRQSALQPLKVVRERAAGGAIPTDQGLRLPLKVAAKERRLGLPVTVLRRATKKCELLPEGKLPSEKWPPGGPDNGVITILEADGIRFKKAWNRAVKLGQTI